MLDLNLVCSILKETWQRLNINFKKNIKKYFKTILAELWFVAEMIIGI